MWLSLLSLLLWLSYIIRRQQKQLVQLRVVSVVMVVVYIIGRQRRQLVQRRKLFLLFWLSCFIIGRQQKQLVQREGCLCCTSCSCCRLIFMVVVYDYGGGRGRRVSRGSGGPVRQSTLCGGRGGRATSGARSRCAACRCPPRPPPLRPWGRGRASRPAGPPRRCCPRR